MAALRLAAVETNEDSGSPAPCTPSPKVAPHGHPLPGPIETLGTHPLWAVAVSHPLRVVRVLAMAGVFTFMWVRSFALYKR